MIRVHDDDSYDDGNDGAGYGAVEFRLTELGACRIEMKVKVNNGGRHSGDDL